MLPWVVNCRHRPARATVQHRHNDLSAVLALAIHLVQFPYCTVFLPIPFSFNRFHVVQQKQGGGRGVQSMTTRSISGISSPDLFTVNCGLITVDCLSPLSPIIPAHPGGSPVTPIIPALTHTPGGGGPFFSTSAPTKKSADISSDYYHGTYSLNVGAPTFCGRRHRREISHSEDSVRNDGEDGTWCVVVHSAAEWCKLWQ